MNVRPFLDTDSPLLEQAGGCAKLYGNNICKWMKAGYVEAADCYVFEKGGALLGGVCFCDDTKEERDIFDFALTDITPDGHEWLIRAVEQAAKPNTRKIAYNLYNDTEQFADIKRLFARAGFAVEQEKLQYVYDKPVPAVCPDTLTFRSVADVGEELFVEVVERVTVGSLDRLMVDDAARLGSRRAAREYVDGLKHLDFNPDWWRLGYANGSLAGLILPQRFGENEGCINYIGVLPECRGRGYGLALIAEGTRLLTENGVTKIYADIDVANKPLAAILERLGYAFKMDEAVLTRLL